MNLHTNEKIEKNSNVLVYLTDKFSLSTRFILTYTNI